MGSKPRALSPFSLAVGEGTEHKNRMLKRSRCIRMIVAVSALTAALGTALAADNPFLGGWELTIPGGGAGWLGVEDADGQLKASLLWGGGSVVPLDSAKLDNGRLVLTRKHAFQNKGKDGKTKRREGTRLAAHRCPALRACGAVMSAFSVEVMTAARHFFYKLLTPI